jgi:hypothetical protein
MSTYEHGLCDDVDGEKDASQGAVHHQRARMLATGNHRHVGQLLYVTISLNIDMHQKMKPSSSFSPLKENVILPALISTLPFVRNLQGAYCEGLNNCLLLQPALYLLQYIMLSIYIYYEYVDSFVSNNTAQDRNFWIYGFSFVQSQNQLKIICENSS